MKQKDSIENYNIANTLKKDHKINDEFEIMLASLSFEEIIALKLEISSRLFGAKLYGMPIFYSVKQFVNEALLTYALSAARTKKEAAAMLGLSPKDFRKYVKKYVKKLDT